MKTWILLALALAALIGCKGKAEPSFRSVTLGNGSPPSPVYLCNGITGACTMLGDSASDALWVQVAAGSAGSPDGGIQTVQGVTGGTPLPTDGVPAAAGDSFADLLTAGVQVVVKNSAGTYVGLYACNEGTAVGWLMCYDMAAADAGGVAGTTPKWMGLRVPPGACQSHGVTRAFASGLVCYSSATVSTLTTSSAPNFTAEVVYR